MSDYTLEVETAVHAAVQASALCKKIRNDLSAGEFLLKSDKSPVTVADYGSQALICKFVRDRFPDDPIVAEEDSKELRKPDRSGLLERVTGYVRAIIPASSSQPPVRPAAAIAINSQAVAPRAWP